MLRCGATLWSILGQIRNDGDKGQVEAKELILREIEGAPEPLLAEVVDFIRFLKMERAKTSQEIALLSEATLGKDWLRPEEETAWRNL